MNKPIAFIIPWYGHDIPGGAEAECRSLVEHLDESGIKVEVLTTCVKEFLSDWNHNYHKAGSVKINNITVRRFPVRQRNVEKFDAVNYKLMNNIDITSEEEQIYFDEMINSPELNEYIKENPNMYYCFVFIPYMFGTTYWGVKQCPGKSILIPCLHDESYAYMSLIREMVKSVTGIIFHANPEYELAKRLYNLSEVRTAVLGEGVDTNYLSLTNGQRFRDKYGIKDKFILYAGRKDKGKNVDELIEYFITYKTTRPNNNLKLVLIGGGSIYIPIDHKDYILDLGFIDKQDKYDAYSAATIFCNPSKNESFSIVTMESWLAETPVVVNGYCEVTKSFCKESNGGLYYTNFYEFYSIISLLEQDEELNKRLGVNGRRYVISNFSWDAVIEKYVNFFNKIGGTE